MKLTRNGNLMKLDEEEEAQAPVEQAFPLLEESRDACRLSKSSRTGTYTVRHEYCYEF